MRRLAYALGAWAWLACSHPGAGSGADGGGAPDGGRAPDAGPVADGGDALDAGGCGSPFSDGGLLFAGSLDTPRRFALTSDTMFIVATGSPSTSDGTIWRLPLAGGTPVPVATGRMSPDAIAADESGAYFVDSSGVWGLEGDGGVAFADGTLNNALFGDTDLALSPGEVVYATGLRWLVGIPRDGGVGALLYQGDAGALVPSARIAGANAYFLVSNVAEAGLYAVPLDRSSPAMRISPLPAAATSLAVTPEAFVWTQGAGGAGEVVWWPRDGGAPVTLASGLQGPRRPLPVGAAVFFAEATIGNASTSFLQWASLCIPGTAAPVGPVGNGAGDLAVSGPSLFFTSVGSGTQGFVGRLPP